MPRYFTEDHEWIDVEGDVGTVGITDYAQSQLGDITYVELPSEGTDVTKGDSVSVVDSVKAASDVYTPVSGSVTAANAALADEPELVNTDAEETGWLYRIAISDSSELEPLMDRKAYDAYVAGL
ncbi:glycine cleavage system protein GcvH [Novosphingobium aquimarinum]|jgi:glycine cleavage system H protein|uniref:glycine cleavage system protein GcvH n=1 Tax=Novosphingobium aquimarinum TaxID=2682494 RepID=UPI0012ECB9C3|nr:glycine cleavage system protein GcvH [Novosphingobium aquimarinum]